MEHSKLEQLLEMLLYLSSGIKRKKTEVMSYFDMTERTFYRYIDTFRTVGFIIPRPKDGYYYIDKESPYFREIDELLHFSKEEANILQKAIHSIDNENILKQNLINKLYALYDFDRVANTVVKQAHSEHIHQLMQAIRKKKRVVLRNYQSGNSDVVKDRLVEPFDFTTNYMATWAYDVESGMCKTFRNTRMSSVEVLNDDACFAEEHRALPIDIFRFSSAKQIPIKLKMTMRAADLLKEEYPLSEADISQVDSDFFLETNVCSYEGVGRFVLGLSGDVDIVSPPELITFVRNKVRKYLN